MYDEKSNLIIEFFFLNPILYNIIKFQIVTIGGFEILSYISYAERESLDKSGDSCMKCKKIHHTKIAPRGVPKSPQTLMYQGSAAFWVSV